MASCAVEGCPITYNNRPGAVALHGFPKAAEMKQKWLDAIKTKTPINTMSAVCSMHFDNVSKCVVANKTTRLFHLAVPSINLTEEEASQLISGPNQNLPSPAPTPTQICRVCLKSDSPLSPLFDDTVDEQNCLASKLMLATDVYISTWDDRTRSICIECQRLVESTLTIRQLCKTSDTFFEEAEQRAVNKKKEEYKKNINTKFVCDHCGWVFSSAFRLHSHEYTHTGESPFACTECPKKFTTKASLVLHQMKHTGESRCICEMCGLGFTTASLLKQHFRMHTGEKPYSCSVCEKTFGNASTLNWHKRSHSAEEYLHDCHLCDYKTTAKKYLNIHMLRHANKPYKCDVCQRLFKLKTTLENHLQLHTDQQTFGCDVCNKRFQQKSSLVIHKQSHTSVERFLCSDCGEQFGYESKLQVHQRSCSGAVVDDITVQESSDIENRQ